MYIHVGVLHNSAVVSCKVRIMYLYVCTVCMMYSIFTKYAYPDCVCVCPCV